MKTKRLPLTALQANEANPRHISPARLEQLKRSLADDPEMLEARPLIALPDGTVIAGNMRLRAAQELGWDTIPVTTVDLDDERAKLWLLKDNQAYGDWADIELAELLQSLQQAGVDLDRTGFTDAAVSRLLDRITPAAPDEDDVPEPPVEAETKPGDVIELGPHRLVCGDATSLDAYEQLLGKERAACIWTDPPYNVDYVGKTSDALTIQNDHMADSAFEAFLTAAFASMNAYAEPGCPIYVAHADTKRSEFAAGFAAGGWLHKQTLVWIKNVFVLGRQDYQWQHEPMLYGWKDGAAHHWYGGFDKITVADDEPDPRKLTKPELVKLVQQLRNERQTTVVREDRPSRSPLHPTTKPVGLIATLLANSSKRGDIVLDPFAGSGSTLMAADRLGRRARLIELDPGYCDVIRKRYAGLAG